MVANIVSWVLAAIFGAGGIVGLVFAYLRRFIDKRITQREAEHAKAKEIHVRRMKVEDEWKHALGRLMFFVHKAIVTGQHNGDLASSWEKFQETEEKLKQLDREVIVEYELIEHQ